MCVAARDQLSCFLRSPDAGRQRTLRRMARRHLVPGALLFATIVICLAVLWPREPRLQSLASLRSPRLTSGAFGAPPRA
ncbi:hypothetical protein SBV1_1370009 [Verrucomicrobia bacterium]|nr:hypothetical protein SBV1_1370009 [Verrucomicrobiota bacterium]